VISANITDNLRNKKESKKFISIKVGERMRITISLGTKTATIIHTSFFTKYSTS
jgi:hypothetical protein